MKFKRAFWTGYIIFMMTLLFLGISFSQVRTGEVISFSGVIESTPEDYKFIVINELRIYISPETKIVDDNGNILKIDELQSRLNVIIEVVKNSNGSFAKKIIIKKKK